MSGVPRCDRRLPGRRDACGTPMHEQLDAIGRVLWCCVRCAWREAGRCWACGASRENPRALLCVPCRDARRRAACRQHDASPDRQHKSRLRDRRRSRTAKRQAWRKAWIAANPDKVKRYKRREALNPTPRRREREAWWNAQPERAEKKRQQARAAYYAQRPERPQPVCRVCAAPIPYTPPGRPKVRCDGCVPASVRALRKRQPMAQEAA